MSSTSNQINNQSLNGIIILTDGILEISNGQIDNLENLSISGNLNANKGTFNTLTSGNIVVGNINVGNTFVDSSSISNRFTSSNNTLLYNSVCKELNIKNINSNRINTQRIVSNNIKTNNLMVDNITLNNPLILFNKEILTINDIGIKGEICFYNNDLYICIDTNQWRKTTLNTF